MFDVLVVGELNVDVILNHIDGLPEVGKEKLAREFTITLGSSSAIFASNLSTLGSKVAFMGKIGQDTFGDLTIASLKKKKVDTEFILRSEQFQTGSTIVLNYDMDRAMVTYPGAMEELSAKEVRDDILSEARHLHVSSVFLQPTLKEHLVQLFSRAKTLGLTTSLDPQWDPAEKWDLDLKSLLPHVDVFLPNRKELMLLTGTKSLMDGIDQLKAFANVLAVKDGANGAILYHDGHITNKPAFLNSNVTDCIGAGDSFDAGFVSQFIQGKKLSECLEFANLSGAINTTCAGGTTAFASWEQVKKTAQDRFSYPLK